MIMSDSAVDARGVDRGTLQSWFTVSELLVANGGKRCVFVCRTNDAC